MDQNQLQGGLQGSKMCFQNIFEGNWWSDEESTLLFAQFIFYYNSCFFKALFIPVMRPIGEDKYWEANPAIWAPRLCPIRCTSSYCMLAWSCNWFRRSCSCFATTRAFWLGWRYAVKLRISNPESSAPFDQSTMITLYEAFLKDARDHTIIISKWKVNTLNCIMEKADFSYFWVRGPRWDKIIRKKRKEIRKKGAFWVITHVMLQNKGYSALNWPISHTVTPMHKRYFLKVQ